MAKEVTAAKVSSNVKEIEEEDLSQEFADLVEENFGDQEESVQPAEGEEAKPEGEPAPAEPVEEEAQAVKPEEAPKAEEPPQVPTPVAETQPAAQQPQGEQAPQTPTDLNAQYKEFFEKSVDALEKSVYALPPEVVEELDTNPSKVIPKLAATLHMQVLSAALTQVANLFPSMLAVHNDQASHSKQTEDKFFGEYPKLKGHEALVQRIAATYRQMNPNATYEQIAPEVAAMAMVQARIPIASAPAESPALQPVVPTSARGAAPVRATQENKTTWDELIEGE